MICFTWWGLTQYAARAIQSFIQASGEDVIVVATRPSSPIKGMEEILSCPVIWVEENDLEVANKLPEIPKILFVNSWRLPCWTALGKVVRRNGGKIVATVDTNFSWGYKAFLRFVYFELVLRWRFAAYFVCGASGRRLMRSYLVSQRKIFEGLYGADKNLFHDGEALSGRQKRIIYVGQFIVRKNVIRLVDAFEIFHKKYPDWQLLMCGHGPLHEQIKKTDGVEIRDFVQPTELAGLYRFSRAFILPSLDEHWGVVVHEAALSGCYLLLSDRIGSAADFAGRNNARKFNPYSVEEIVSALSQMAELPDGDLDIAQVESCERGSRFGLNRFTESVMQICKELEVR